MRFFLAGILFVSALQEGAPDKLALRYTYEVNEDSYPQKTPADTLKSAVKAIKANRFDYLMAQLADPPFVDKKVADYKAQYKGDAKARTVLAFERLVKETTQHFQDDPLLLQELQQYAKDAEWKMEEQTAVATLKTIPGQSVHMHKVGSRWFLENRR
jgi:hypothetical protein